ncbi:MAG: L,D-transpeptidase [Rhodobiaceae bacterium]|nr:L,D-transpeptidase [Rhodobiaceae bacterium]MCC0055932.1 L,D-transpeptidase [Rhodobiaceae bacterium]
MIENRKHWHSRRQILTGLSGAAALALAGCSTTRPMPQILPAGPVPGPTPGGIDPYYEAMYGPLPQERFPVPPVDLSKVPPQFYRREVAYPTSERVGTLVVDTSSFYLYLVQENGRALRYGVGLGREGFAWKGRARVGWKQAWPKWTPPDEMIGRQPELAQYSADNGGMPPGLQNPLGARALYIFQGNKDTLYRIHGSPEYWTIGTAVSSGCVRMMNQDVIDLYGRVPTDSPIVVL